MDRETLIRQSLPICRHEARRWRHLGFLEQEDLVSEGMVGLVKAADRFDPERGVPFNAFARPHIRGAILDVVRAVVKRHLLRDGTYAQVESIDGTFSDRWAKKDDRPRLELSDPGALLEDRFEQLEAIRLISGLPDQERHALLRTKIDGAHADDVGDELGVTAHRVYVLVAHGAERLRRRAA